MNRISFLKRSILFILASFLFFETALSGQVLAVPMEFKFQSQVKNYYLKVGEKVNIKASALFSNGRATTLTKDFKAKVKNSKIAKLKGYELTGISNGQTILELSYSGKKFTANIFVGDKKPETAQVILDPDKEKEGKKVPAVFYTRNNGTITLKWKKQKDIKR